ncbi:ABC transporter permease [Oceanispirochaeta crateris]|uniref:ABC transporter permease n=1 Tax=Oceanispirochaeta crateris TaxID=2518645 RepID=A0A5C1QMB3_9SPIO|nr:ABC transporter permease [Oceanispirochaeta crateris]QEN08349.1 ABC transporter permease [Oceanispirochaeta crateris]
MKITNVEVNPIGFTSIIKRILKNSSFSIFVVMMGMCIAMYIVSPPFRSMNNLLAVAKNSSAYAIAGIGVLMVIITGGIDLSIGSIFGLAGVIASMGMVDLGLPVIPSILLGMLIGTVLGLTNGLLIVKVKLPPFIATLGMLSIVRSLCYILTEGYPVTGITEDFLFLGQGFYLSIPAPIWVMVFLAIIFSIFLNKTVIGRHIYALGGNEEATRISGINTDKLKLLVYSLGGCLYGIAGIITASKLGIGQPTAGQGYELDAIAAVIIGGASLIGGAGTISGTIIGAAIMGILRNALVLLSIKSHWQQFIIGFVIILAVTLDQLRRSRKSS